MPDMRDICVAAYAPVKQCVLLRLLSNILNIKIYVTFKIDINDKKTFLFFICRMPIEKLKKVPVSAGS
jgi:hypothetical protein